MIKIKLNPSFHNSSLITINKDIIEYEILPRLRDLGGLDKKERLTSSEYLELKEIKLFNKEAKKRKFIEKNEMPNNLVPKKLKIEEIINHIADKPQIDERMILDGIHIECSTFNNNIVTNKIEFQSPDDKMKEFEIIKNLFLILNGCFTNSHVLNHMESIQGYFGIGKKWKITNKNPLTLRLFGSLSIYEKGEIIEVFNSLKSNEFLILDIRNLDGMGATFHECFIKLIDQMKAVFWLIQDRENELLKRHFNEMNISNKHIFTNKSEIIKKIKEHNTM